MPDFKALVRSRLGPLPLDPARAADIVDELAQHAADHYAELVAGGATEAEALVAALAPLDASGRTAIEIARADRVRVSAPTPPPAARGSIAADVVRDARYAARLLARAPGFAAAAIVTLALGIGANAAIFSVVNAVLMRPLPYADPSRLVVIGGRDVDNRAGNLGYLTLVDWRARTHAFDGLAAIRSWNPTLAGGDGPERVAGMRVSANFFRLLGAAPAAGRDFADDEDTPARRRVVVLSDRLWRRRFHADARIVGQSIDLSDGAYTVVGVMPASFPPLVSEHFYEAAELWAPIGYDATQPQACRNCQHLKAIGRVKREVTIAAAERDLSDIQAALRREHPADYESQSGVVAIPLAAEIAGPVRTPLLVLMGAVVFVLVIACANVANLLLARLAARERALALRAALGASAGRMIRQLLIESALVAAAGAALGVAGAAALVPLLARLTPVPIPRLAEARIDAPVLAFAAAAAIATTIGFGLLPAIRASRFRTLASLAGGGRLTGGAPNAAARRLLIGADIAIAVALLAGAGLMIKSVGRLLGVDPGFDPDRVLTLQLSMTGPAYAKNDAVVAKGDEILARLQAIGGVEAAALAGQIPLGGNRDSWGVHVEGRRWTADDPSLERYSVTPDYFRAMRIPLRRGRLISDADRASTPFVLLVGERTARALWPNEDPIGRRLRIGGTDGPWHTIVGIVGDVRHDALAEPPRLQMYTAQRQITDSFLTVVVRTSGDPAAIAREARQAIAVAAADVPIYKIAPLREVVETSVGPRRFVMVLLEIFSGVALLMTAVGVYGVVAYSVAERTREIGIRAALGASRADVARLVLGGGLPIVAAGAAAGIALAAVTTRFLRESLFGVSATDAPTFAGVVATLFAVAVAAHLVPLARATRVDPTVALREE